MKKTICVLTLLSAASGPAMADSLNLAVTGQILTPACNITLPDGPVVDYGNIAHEQLDTENYTLLDDKTFNLELKCNAPIKVSLSAENGKPGTMALNEGDTEVLHGVGVAPVELLSRRISGVGLGLSGGKKIGGYTMLMPKGVVYADGKVPDVIGRLSTETDWTYNGSGVFYTTRGKQYLSFADAGSVTPIAIQNMTATIYLQAYINKQSELNVLDEITLDGQTTLELNYL